MFSYFFLVKTVRLCICFFTIIALNLKHVSYFWLFYRLFLFFVDFFFISGRRRYLFIITKYKNTFGYHSNYTNTIYISITRSNSNSSSRSGGTNGDVDSIITCIIVLWLSMSTSITETNVCCLIHWQIISIFSSGKKCCRLRSNNKIASLWMGCDFFGTLIVCHFRIKLTWIWFCLTFWIPFHCHIDHLNRQYLKVKPLYKLGSRNETEAPKNIYITFTDAIFLLYLQKAGPGTSGTFACNFLSHMCSENQVHHKRATRRRKGETSPPFI